MSLQTICLPVRSELALVEETLSKAASSDVELVQNAAIYALGSGGKRIRPALLLLTAKMLGAGMDSAVKLAASIEMVHAASLMHDDVLDNATLRRGKPSSNVKWGNQISILVGDFLWCAASDLAIKNGNKKVYLSLLEAVSRTTEGEILEIVHANDFALKHEQYLKVICLKTATLFRSSCHIGALLAEAGEEFETAVADFGLNLGISFQLADDVLDYAATNEKLGKRIGTDLSEGRLTLPLILALEKANADESAAIKNALLSASTDESKFETVKDILKRYDSLETSLKEARSYAKMAKDRLAQFKPSIFKDSLMAIADHAVARNE